VTALEKRAYKKRTLRERLMARAEFMPSGCWLWTGARTRNGYGQIRVEYQTRLAHRVSYDLFVGPVPDGLDLDHRCRNRACVNPDHLEPVTRRENLSRGTGHGTTTHCAQGHPYSGDNLYITARGFRGCRACNRRKARRERVPA